MVSTPPDDQRKRQTPPPGAASQAYASAYHAPVLSQPVTDALVTDAGGLYVDATLGGGGHAQALLDALAPGGRVLGIDRDAEALDAAAKRLAKAVTAGRFRTLRGNFADLRPLLEEAGALPADGLLLDLGVSSHQIDARARGFSFQQDGPLDMRMDRRQGRTAAEVVNEWDEGDLRQILYNYGEERRAAAIVRAMVKARPLETTGALADAVRSATPTRDEVKTLARVFQAFRIAVNGELEALEAALRAGAEVLRPGGRMAVISYHSLEDRRVKRFFKYGNFENRPVRDFYGNLLTPWRRVTKGPVRASDKEVAANPRARSARLRIAERRADRRLSSPSPTSPDTP